MIIQSQPISDKTVARMKIGELRLAINRRVKIARDANRELVKLVKMAKAYGLAADYPRLMDLAAYRKEQMTAARELAESIRKIRKEHNMQQVTDTTGLKPFTVLCVQGLGVHSGIESYHAHVMAPDHHEATVLAIAEAANSFEADADEIDAIGVYDGHIQPVNWSDDGIEVDVTRFSKRQVNVLPKV